MGGLASAAAAAAPVTTAARVVSDAYMAGPADVAAAPATVSRMEFIPRDKVV